MTTGRIRHRSGHEIVLPAELVDVVVEALRASAEVHEAEHIPHLVAPLRALSDELASR